jgi:glycosyltransferase involved in cell wall biosynthesis
MSVPASALPISIDGKPVTISLVTACYNAAGTIAETLDSVASQTIACEHIIVDGASRDSTLQIVSSWDRHSVKCVSEPDTGIYDAMNRGVGRCTGDVIGFLNADDIYASPNVLAQVASVMSDPLIDACYADVVYVDALGNPCRWWRCGPYEKRAVSRGWAPAHPAFYARRSVYERYGAFDLAYRLAGDHECMTRLLVRHKIRVVYIPFVWVYMRLGGASNGSLRNIVRQNVEIISGLRRNQIPISSVLPFWKIRERIIQRINARFYTRSVAGGGTCVH